MAECSLAPTPHAATATELKAQIEAEREGLPFLIYRDGDGHHQITVLAGRPSSGSRSDGARRQTSR